MADWDSRFLEMAVLVSKWSKDPSTKVGAVIAKGKFVVSLGFNGHPAGVADSAAGRLRSARFTCGLSCPARNAPQSSSSPAFTAW
jgi:deoxycytidylate deaminase